MFPSFPALILRHRSLFELNSSSGLMISQTVPISPAILTYAINLPYLKVEFTEDEFGRKHPLQLATRVFQANIILQNTATHLIFGFGSSSFSAQFNYSPLPWLSLSSSLSTNSSPEFNFSASNKYSNLTVGMTSNDVNFTLTGGKEVLHFGVQFAFDLNKQLKFNKKNFLLENKKNITGSSLMIGHQDEDLKFQWILLSDNGLATVVKVQNSFTLLDYPVDLGCALQLTANNQTDAVIAWMTEIKGSVIHSSISKAGIVKSCMKMKLNSVCDASFDVKLNHSECDYSFGISLNFL